MLRKRGWTESEIKGICYQLQYCLLRKKLIDCSNGLSFTTTWDEVLNYSPTAFFLSSSFIVFSIYRPTVGQNNEKVGIYRSQNTIHRQEAAKSIWEKILVVSLSILMNENTITKNNYKNNTIYVKKAKVSTTRRYKLANTSGHAQDETPNALLRNVLPYFSEGSFASRASDMGPLYLTLSSSQFTPQALNGIAVSTWWTIDSSDARNSRLFRQRWRVTFLSWSYQPIAGVLPLMIKKNPSVALYPSESRRQSWSSNEILTKDSFQFIVTKYDFFTGRKMKWDSSVKTILRHCGFENGPTTSDLLLMTRQQHSCQRFFSDGPLTVRLKTRSSHSTFNRDEDDLRGLRRILTWHTN